MKGIGYIKEAAGRFERITNHVTLKYGRNKTKLITVVKIAHLYLMFGTARNLNLFAVNGRQYAGHVFVESYLMIWLDSNPHFICRSRALKRPKLNRS